MPPTKSLNNANNINSRFMQEMFMNSLNVPLKLLREHRQMGLSERELVVLLRLLPLYYNQGGLTVSEVAAEFAVTEEEAAALLGPLVAKEIVLPQDTGERAYSLDGLFMQLYELWSIEKRRQHRNAVKAKIAKADTSQHTMVEIAQLYRVFERELGRNLSPIESEKIAYWLEQEQQSSELIVEALRRAVLQGKASFAYIDKILLNWRQHGISEPVELEAKEAAPAKKQGRKATAERVKDTWLDHYNG